MHQTAFDSSYTAFTADGARWLVDNVPSVRATEDAGIVASTAVSSAPGAFAINQPASRRRRSSPSLHLLCVQVRAVGIDYLSVATLDHIVDAHVTLLGHVSPREALVRQRFEGTAGMGAANAVQADAAPADSVCKHPGRLATCNKRFGLRDLGKYIPPVCPTCLPHLSAPYLTAQGIVAVEGLVLGQVQPGIYTMHALPLKIVGADGAPARVILTQ